MERNRKNTRENDTALAAAVLLQNVLILIVIGAFAWAMRLMVVQSDSLDALWSGGFLQ